VTAALPDDWPQFWFFTDPERTPDPVAIARTLPRGTAVVYRHFRASDRKAVADALRQVRGLRLLIGADPALAAQVGADGVHWPERLGHRAAALKRMRPGWLVTVAAHSAAALRRAAGADAAVLSPVFASRSASAGRALGLARAARMAAQAPVSVIGLGGVTRARADLLLRRGFAGAAGVDLFLEGRSEPES
jgi:thiamine-phosphate pyrophosphorylase